jgi:ABC-type iron transport system FetAB permease component
MTYETLLLNMVLAMIALKIYHYKKVKPENDWLANLVGLLVLDYFLKGVFHG